MTKLNEDAARLDSLRVNFTIIMWALLFFLPLPIPGLGVTPDVLAWGLLLIGVGATVRHVTGLGLMWATAAAGMALWVVRAVVGAPPEGTTSPMAVGLYMGMWVLVTAFTVQLASLIRRLALEMHADDLAHSVVWRAWLPLVPLAARAALPLVPARARLPFGGVFLLVTACVVSLMMGMAAGTARMFSQAAKQASRNEDEAMAARS